MESIVAIALILVSIVLLKIIFKIDVKKIEPLKENKVLQELTDRFPENVEVAQEILKMLGNDKVIVEETKNTETSLYIAITDKILIADMKNNYARIQTIAHECIHSIQDKRLLLFNFIFSNIAIIYMFVITVLTITKVVQDTTSQIYILTMFTIIKFAVRSYLEIDAMTKSKYLAKEYMEKKNILKKQDVTEIIKKYDEINAIGIPFTIVHILTSSLLVVLGYSVISLVI